KDVTASLSLQGECHTIRALVFLLDLCSPPSFRFRTDCHASLRLRFHCWSFPTRLLRRPFFERSVLLACGSCLRLRPFHSFILTGHRLSLHDSAAQTET